jgi:hypothetical protein
VASLDGYLQLPGRVFGQNRYGIGGGPVTASRCQLRAAPQARPETMGFGLDSRVKKNAMVLTRQLDAANGAAINAGRGDAREKHPIPSRITLCHSLVAALCIQVCRRCWSGG